MDESQTNNHGYYEVHCAVFDKRDGKDDGPYDVAVSIVGDEERLNDVQSQMSNILNNINDSEGSDYQRDAEYIQNHFRSLHRAGLIEDVVMRLDGIDSTTESLIDALDDGRLQFVQ